MTAQLQRKLGLWACVSIVAGSVIGSSIFMKPATMAGQLGSPLLLLFVWVLTGIVSIFGGMINAEIGTMLPETGGQYAYFRHMYGRFFSYLFGWSSFIVINTSAVAAISFIAAQYTTYFIDLPAFPPDTERSVVWYIPFIGELFPLQNIGVKLLAMILVVLFTVINIRSVAAAGRIQVVFTVAKIGALIFIILGIFFSGKGSFSNMVDSSASMDFSTWPMTLAFVAAASGALAAYDGWNNLGFNGGEIINPQKNIPRGLIWGLIICMILYVLTTQAFLYVMPVEVMKDSKMVATDALSIVMGAAGAIIIALLVIISSTGAINGNILPVTRSTFAMARDGLFFRSAGRVHPRFHTPHVALWLHCLVTCLFILTGSFDMLADLFVFMIWLFYGFAAYGIFILRRKMPDAPRPYRLKGYPVIPIVFLAFSLFYFSFTLYNDISNYLEGRSKLINATLGLSLTAAGIPFYFYFISRKKGKE
jgi:basic amino acid/polyamine antiporter, APA family